MTDPSLSAAKIVLLAVQAAAEADIKTLRTLTIKSPKTLRTELILRVLLSYLPETLDPSEYVQYLLDLASGETIGDSTSKIDTSSLDDVSDSEASKRVRKLRLLPLLWPAAPEDAPDDSFVLFVIHRAYRIDEETGLITQLPDLVVPFLDRSTYLRTWMISTLLPLLRLNYEYHPSDSTMQTIKSFESLDDWTGVITLLSRTGKSVHPEGNAQTLVGRDLRGLVGPWLYGDSRAKRRKLQIDAAAEAQFVAPSDERISANVTRHPGWDEVFRWITSQATISWTTCVQAIEQWDGPSDVDLGGYGDSSGWLEEQEQQQLERLYARTALASAYLIPQSSDQALVGIHKILARLITLLDLERIPTLSAAAAFLAPVNDILGNDILSANIATQLRTGLLDEANILTTPSLHAINFLHALLISAYLLTRAGVDCTIRRAGELVLLQDERDQMVEFTRLVHKMGNGPKGDDKYWIRMRNELIWLRDWTGGDLSESAPARDGRGVFGKIKRDFLEIEILKALLANTRYTLARSIYETSPSRPLSKEKVQNTVISAAMNAFDNATNANRTRGGVKKCDDILKSFPDSTKDSLAPKRIKILMTLTHSLEQFRLVLKQGQPFTPVFLRVHSDPISVIGKILDQNPKSYTKINELVHMGEQMVLSGLTVHDVEGHSTFDPEIQAEQLISARRRVTSMCIDAALVENDFETAYSYIITRLSSVASEAQSRSPAPDVGESGVFAQPAPRVLDDWSWRAALQAGKYRINENMVKPTHLGNSSGNPEIRHLEQRIECLSQSLRIAPPQTLPEILNVYRRCEEELKTKITEEADQEAAWDEQGDENIMPGGFAADVPINLSRAGAITSTAASRTGEEAPMSLFDLTRATANQAQKSFSALTAIKKNSVRENPKPPSSLFPSHPTPGTSSNSGIVNDDHSLNTETDRVRKRDQLRNAAVGTVASGLGWILGAQPVGLQHEQAQESD